jgi:CheY-like chemotaxis protein
MNDETRPYKEVSILLVDDDDVDAMGVLRALKRLKILNSVVRARDGVEALEMLRNGSVQRPFVILLDINMPRMNGLEMLEAVRNDPLLSSSVVFMLTTSQDDQDRLNAYQQHVAGYIVKRHAGDGFLRVMEMLDRYWRVVELPC